MTFITIQKCKYCHKKHFDLKVKIYAATVIVNGSHYRYYVECPTTQQPINIPSSSLQENWI